MKRATLAALAVCAFVFAACGADVDRLGNKTFLVTEVEGNYDLRDLNRACGSVKNVAAVRGIDISNVDSAALVTCKVAPRIVLP